MLQNNMQKTQQLEKLQEFHSEINCTNKGKAN